MKTDNLAIIAVLIIVLAVIGSCVYSVNMPGDLICTDILELDTNMYSLQNCKSRDYGGDTYNLILTIDNIR